MNIPISKQLNYQKDYKGLFEHIKVQPVIEREFYKVKNPKSEFNELIGLKIGVAKFACHVDCWDQVCLLFSVFQGEWRTEIFWDEDLEKL